MNYLPEPFNSILKELDPASSNHPQNLRNDQGLVTSEISNPQSLIHPRSVRVNAHPWLLTLGAAAAVATIILSATIYTEGDRRIEDYAGASPVTATRSNDTVSSPSSVSDWTQPHILPRDCPPGMHPAGSAPVHANGQGERSAEDILARFEVLLTSGPSAVAFARKDTRPQEQGQTTRYFTYDGHLVAEVQLSIDSRGTWFLASYERCAK